MILLKLDNGILSFSLPKKIRQSQDRRKAVHQSYSQTSCQSDRTHGIEDDASVLPEKETIQTEIECVIGVFTF